MCTADNKNEQKQKQKDLPPSNRESEGLGTVTYERKHVSHTDLAQLSTDFDVVIVAAGAGDLRSLVFFQVSTQQQMLLRFALNSSKTLFFAPDIYRILDAYCCITHRHPSPLGS